MKKIFLFICVISISLAFYPSWGKRDNFRMTGANNQIGVPKAKIVITQPNASTKVQMGKAFKIVWNKKGLMHPRVRIILVPSDRLLIKGIKSGQKIINAGTPNSGTYRWNIPKTVRPGKYRIRIITLDNSVRAESAIFNIFKLEVERACMKVDLVVARHFRRLDNPQKGPGSSGYDCYIIKNLKHPGVKYPAGKCFMFKVIEMGWGVSMCSKRVCASQILTLRNTGQVIIKCRFSITPDPLPSATYRAIVDYTNTVDECNENNNRLHY